MRISDWSSDVCSSDLRKRDRQVSNSNHAPAPDAGAIDYHAWPDAGGHFGRHGGRFVAETLIGPLEELAAAYDAARVDPAFVEAFDKDLAHYVGRPSPIRSEEHTSELQSLMRISYAVFCLKKKTNI